MKKESEKVQKQQTKPDSTSVERVTELVSMLNQYLDDVLADEGTDFC